MIDYNLEAVIEARKADLMRHVKDYNDGAVLALMQGDSRAFRVMLGRRAGAERQQESQLKYLSENNNYQ